MNINAHEYKINATKVALHLLREPDVFETNMKLFCAKDLEEAFIAGAEWRKQQSTWVSVKDRLPRSDKMVLCQMKSNNAIVSGYITRCLGHKPQVLTAPDFEFEYLMDYEPIAWMPIPECGESGCSEKPNDQKAGAGEICGNCDAYCECALGPNGAKHDNPACEYFDDSVLSQLNKKDHEIKTS